jgi:hypothetical protein
VGDSQVRKEANHRWFVSSVLPFPPPDEHTASAALDAPAPGQRHVPDDKDDMFGHTAHRSPPAHCDAHASVSRRDLYGVRAMFLPSPSPSHAALHSFGAGPDLHLPCIQARAGGGFLSHFDTVPPPPSLASARWRWIHIAFRHRFRVLHLLAYKRERRWISIAFRDCSRLRRIQAQT